jgi:formyltetrahydrofolate synthetase
MRNFLILPGKLNYLIISSQIIQEFVKSDDFQVKEAMKLLHNDALRHNSEYSTSESAKTTQILDLS